MDTEGAMSVDPEQDKEAAVDLGRGAIMSEDYAGLVARLRDEIADREARDGPDGPFTITQMLRECLAAIASLCERVEALEADNARLREAIRLEGQDAEFYFLGDSEGRLFVDLNDTFGYAIADAEPIPWEEFDAVIATWKADPVSLLLWAAKKRGMDPADLAVDARVPPSTRDTLTRALAEGRVQP
jgi:hypothetical protein